MLLNKSQFEAVRDSMLLLNNVGALIDVYFSATSICVEEYSNGGVILYERNSKLMKFEEAYKTQIEFFDAYENFYAPKVKFFKAGDRVSYKWCSDLIERGTVVEVDTDPVYKVVVLFDGGSKTLSFTEDGRFDDNSDDTERLKIIEG